MTDEELLERFRSHRDRKAIDALYSRSSGIVHAAVAKAVRRGADPDEALSAANMRFMVAVRTYRPGPMSFSSFLWRSLMIIGRDYFGKRWKRQVETTPLTESAIAVEPSPDALALRELAAISRETLRDRWWEILSRWMHGESSEEIAADLGISGRRVRQILAQARSRLRDRFAA